MRRFLVMLAERKIRKLHRRGEHDKARLLREVLNRVLGYR